MQLLRVKFIILLVANLGMAAYRRQNVSVHLCGLGAPETQLPPRNPPLREGFALLSAAFGTHKMKGQATACPFRIREASLSFGYVWELVLIL